MTYRWSLNVTERPGGLSTECYGNVPADIGNTFPTRGIYQSCEQRSDFQTVIERDESRNVVVLVILDTRLSPALAGKYEFPAYNLSTDSGAEVYVGPPSFYVEAE